VNKQKLFCKIPGKTNSCTGWKSTKGTIFLTASAPLGDIGITNTNYNLNNSLAQLYQNIVFNHKKLESWKIGLIFNGVWVIILLLRLQNMLIA
jgi:hypothetical protein